MTDYNDGKWHKEPREFWIAVDQFTEDTDYAAMLEEQRLEVIHVREVIEDSE